MQHTERIDYLLRRLKNEKITQEELGELKHFFKDESLTDHYFKDSYDNFSGEYRIGSDYSREMVWEDIASKIDKREGGWGKALNAWKWLAAVLVAFIGSAVFFNSYHTPHYITVENSSGKLREIRLPDSSLVFLNSGSALRYYTDFKSNRELFLEGEGFFNVTRDTMHPFSVRTGEIVTRVLGTSFNIDTKDSVIKVVVNTGLVRVFNSEQSYKLNPDEMIEYDPYSRVFRENRTRAPFHNLWTVEKASFASVSLGELSEAFELLYDTRLVFEEESLKDKQLYSFFILRNESVHDLVDRINYINEVQLKIRANDIIVQPKQ
ncbi:FecR family protein [Sinomicrobium oceani]|nr:FecR family protein [Sinomicrobium oceani]